ncbi:hypothetical protein BO94DRAFT_530210 [Aspergillus sclerotioniger CBS 115572]|uniref:Uncharacterized protein n=1 Tax=Aspergillus sclerotioniger CBS 115572 TaxID=1450535 RepID=A0A317XAR0_9EURO|nr:hypothetical protein BO94DRAFT_530210 [Aspergillus sclerotioniger CBS 115572]PWY95485.1 hypothetical protein BO94DRAFT_530210 [Aspergillus sclerotioniger CBS 115572]
MGLHRIQWLDILNIAILSGTQRPTPLQAPTPERPEPDVSPKITTRLLAPWQATPPHPSYLRSPSLSGPRPECLSNISAMEERSKRTSNGLNARASQSAG